MEAQDNGRGGGKRKNQFFDWMIPLAGIILILFATAMFGLFQNTPNNVVISIALFGVGCAALWFGLFHADIHASANKIERIKEKTEKVGELIQKSKK
jgi:hypothetical protein